MVHTIVLPVGARPRPAVNSEVAKLAKGWVGDFGHLDKEPR